MPLEGGETGCRWGRGKTLTRPHQGGQGVGGGDAEGVDVLETDVVVRRLLAEHFLQYGGGDAVGCGATIPGDHGGMEAILHPPGIQEAKEVVKRAPRHLNESELAVEAVRSRQLGEQGQKTSEEAGNTGE